MTLRVGKYERYTPIIKKLWNTKDTELLKAISEKGMTLNTDNLLLNMTDRCQKATDMFILECIS